MIDQTKLADEIGHLRGLYVGSLSSEEMDLFNAACKAGVAKRVYEGVGGFMGLAKVAVIQQGVSP